MMNLFIAEKPSVAKAIVGELGKLKGGQGCIECKGGNVVTWCFGHLLEQAEPDAYLSDDIPKTKKGNKIWRMQDLPIFPSKWKLLPKSDKGVKAQLKMIKTLLPKADVVINAGDPDREGQLLVDEILEFYQCKKPVKRFWVSAQDPVSIRKGLSNLLPNKKFEGMKKAALGRSQADWLIGMNLTRALTLAHSSKEERKLIAVGRVQTPTLALVAQRDMAIRNFRSVPFYVFKAYVGAKNGQFTATWQPSENQVGLDEVRRLISRAEAQKLLQKLQNCKQGKILKAESQQKKTGQPKVYSLADIQLEASNKFGYSAEETLDTCQSLYEKHKIASYPRSDCQFLPESQWSDATEIIRAIASTDANLKEIAKLANPKIKSATWNDKKVTAHHGIIPTRQNVDWSALNEKEKNIYELLAKRYLAQFYPAHEYMEQRIVLDVATEKFTARGITVTKPGWKIIYGNQLDKDSSEDNQEEEIQRLPDLSNGEVVSIAKIAIGEQKTKPPAAFTEGTLIAAMEKIHTVVDNPEHKKHLKESDGIGTPATRAAIISELKRKKYLEVKGKKIHATSLGIELLGLVPQLVKNPVLTAIFERKLKEVEAGTLSLEEFISSQKQFVLQEVNKQKGKSKV